MTEKNFCRPASGAAAGQAHPGYDVEIVGACEQVSADQIRSWFPEKPKRGFDSVCGMAELKDRLLREADLTVPEGWNQILGVNPVRSYIFYGPPGSGKTCFVNALAKELMDRGFRYMRLDGNQLYSRLVGVGEQNIRIAFENAARNEPCLLFIDGLEDVCMDRGQSTNRYIWNMTIAFLQAYSMLRDSGKRVILIGATNRPDLVDCALVDKASLIGFQMPSADAREEYFAKAFGKLPMEEGFDSASMAAVTEGCSYRDLEGLKSNVITKLKTAAVLANTVRNEDGTIREEETYLRAQTALGSGEIVLTRAIFGAAQSERPPADKSGALEACRRFEEKMRGNGF